MDDSTYSELNRHYLEKGWCRVDFPDPGAIADIRDLLETKLRALCGDAEVTLTTYHQAIDDARHADILWALANYFWDEELSYRIGQTQLSVFRAFIGPDLHIQGQPYLRISRPGKSTDNIGLHRDTFYGQSPYEVTVHIPFTTVDADSALCVADDTHLNAEADFEVVSKGKADWDKGSPRHLMGFPYAPKKILDDLGTRLHSVPLQLGQAMIFTPALIHGQEVNRGDTTRVSTDLRIVNSLAPIHIKDKDALRGYRELSVSAATQAARGYHANNGA